MCIQSIVNPKLPILIEAHRENSPRLRKEQRMELPTGYLLDAFSSKVLLICLLGVTVRPVVGYLLGVGVDIEDLTMLGVMVV